MAARRGQRLQPGLRDRLAVRQRARRGAGHARSTRRSCGPRSNAPRAAPTPATEGTIRFVPGKAVAVPGKPGKGIDVAQVRPRPSRTRTARRSRRAPRGPCRCRTTTSKPTVPNAEIDRKMKEFAQPAMSGHRHHQGGQPRRSRSARPSRCRRSSASRPSTASSSTLRQQAALKKLYGNTFDGVLITRGTGKKTPVHARGRRRARCGRRCSKRHDPAQRTGVIPTEPG